MSTLDPYKVSWFSDCAPSLLTNRTIRRYLHGYSQHTWPEVIKLTLLYGILGLEQQYPAGALSIPQLRQLVERGAAQLVVDRNLPGLQRHILNLQSNLDAVFDRLSVEVPPDAPQPAAAAAVPGSRRAQHHAAAHQHKSSQPQQLSPAQQPVLEFPPAASSAVQRPSSVVQPLGPVAPKAPDGWRQGEPTGFPSPPSSRGHPLRRSADNQGATNPIYPDWWLAAGPLPPAQVKQPPQKQPRKQPRLAYSLQLTQLQAPVADDDLVTAEYLMVPSSGYGQQQPQPVVAGEGPPIMITSITPAGISTSPAAKQGARSPAATAVQHGSRSSGTRPRQPAAAAGPQRTASSRPSLGGQRLKAVQSKIKGDVAAARHQASLQQQQRQHALASAVGTAFTSTPEQRHHQEHLGKAGSVAAEAVAACAPAAAAEQFLANPWTSWFLAPGVAASNADRPEHAASTAAVEARSAAALLTELHGNSGELSDSEGEGLHAPEAGAEAAGHGENLCLDMAGSSCSLLQDTRQQGQEQQARGGKAGSENLAALFQQWESQVAAEQMQHDSCRPGSSRAKASQLSSAAEGATAPRGAFTDITHGLNRQHVRPVAGASSTAAAEAVQGPDLNIMQQQQHDQAMLQQQQQRVHHSRLKAWAADFGHLEDVEPCRPAEGRGGRGQHNTMGGSRQHRKWTDKWVGDFGHLADVPRFSQETAFAGQQQQHGSAEAVDTRASEAAAPRSMLFMTPTDLQQLVDAASHLEAEAHVAGSSGAAAAGSSLAGSRSGPASRAVAAATSPSSSTAAAAAERASLQDVAARLAGLLSRLDADAAASASVLPAGVAMRASMEQTDAAAEPIKQSSDPGRDEASLHVAGSREVGITSAIAEAGACADSPGSELAGSYLEGLEETSDMLRQALGRHDALMQLISSLGGGASSPGGED